MQAILCIENSLDMNSDHSFIYLTISDKIIIKDQNPKIINKHTYWDYLNHILENKINLSLSFKITEQLEEELDAFTTAIQEAL